MNITVRYWSWFRGLTGVESDQYTLDANVPLATLLAAVHARHPRLKEVQRSTLVAVGVEYQTPDYRLTAGEEVSLFPPVQGG